MAVWLVAVAVGGGLTLWLQDAGEPEGAYQWQEAEPPDVDMDSDCPGPGITPPPRDDGRIVLCAYATAR